MRIQNHPILPPNEGRDIRFTFAGRPYTALEGDSIASALLAQGIRSLRYSDQAQEPRGLFCGIGNCYECRVWLKGVGVVRACITPIEDGMCIDSKEGG